LLTALGFTLLEFSTAQRFKKFFHTHTRMLEDAGKCAGLDFDMRWHDAAELSTLHHHMTPALTRLLETESAKGLAAFLSANNRQLGHGTIRNR
jgi:hypothetical protein